MGCGPDGWRSSAGLVPLIAHAAVNFAKFGTLFSVPGGRQLLSLQDPARAAWFAGNNESFFSSRFLSTTVVQYLRPDAIRFERLLPFVRFGPVGTNRASYPLLGNTPASSLTLTATLLMILAIVGAVWLVRHRSLTWGLVIVCTTIGALPTFLIGFLANRYLIDMLPPLVVAGALGAWVDRRVGGRPAGPTLAASRRGDPRRVGRLGERVARHLEHRSEVPGLHRAALRARRRDLPGAVTRPRRRSSPATPSVVTV